MTTRAAGRIRRRIQGTERGATLVEFAIVLPLLALLTFGIIEFAVMFNTNSNVAHAGRAGGRAAGISSVDPQMEYKAAQAAANSLNVNPGSISGTPRVCVGRYVAGGPVCGADSIDLPMEQGAPGEPSWIIKVGGQPYGVYPATDNWPVANRNFGCNGGGFDRVVVHVSVEKNLLVPGMFGVFFGGDSTPGLSSSSVFQLEPVPSAVCP